MPIGSKQPLPERPAFSGATAIHCSLTNKAPSPDTVEQICSAVDAACIGYWREALCLHRSAATACLLKRYGVRAQTVIALLPLRSPTLITPNFSHSRQRT